MVEEKSSEDRHKIEDALLTFLRASDTLSECKRETWYESEGNRYWTEYTFPADEHETDDTDGKYNVVISFNDDGFVRITVKEKEVS